MQMKIENPTFGSDFEMFLINYSGSVRSAVGRIGGTKKRPMSIGNDCFRQEDGVAAEFNIPPVSNVEDWINYINYCIDIGNQILHNQDLSLLAESSYVFSQDELNTPEAWEFGCEPSYSCYTEDLVRPLPNDSNPNLRTTGFHVHVGFKSSLNFDAIVKFMKYMDLYLGVPSVILDRDRTRRSFYGKAGDFRFKELPDDGLVIVEYRSLGTGIIKTNKNRNLEFIFNQTNRAIEAFNNNDELPEGIEEVINTYDEYEAANICHKYNIVLPELKIIEVYA